MIGITGKVGSGKSSLFASIIAETEKDGGHVCTFDIFFSLELDVSKINFYTSISLELLCSSVYIQYDKENCFSQL